MNNLNFGSYIEDILTRMKEGDKGYRAMLPLALKTIVILFFKTYMRYCLKNSGDAVLVIYHKQKTW